MVQQSMLDVGLPFRSSLSSLAPLLALRLALLHAGVFRYRPHLQFLRCFETEGGFRRKLFLASGVNLRAGAAGAAYQRANGSTFAAAQ